MILSQRQKTRTSSILLALDGTRTMKVFKCPKTKQMVCSCTCKVHQRMRLKCHLVCAAFGTKPEPLDAVNHWWNDFDLAFLGNEIDKRIRQNLWKTKKLSRMTTGALFPEGMICLPFFPNDREIEHFEATLTKPIIVQRGFWAPRKGTKIMEEAVKLASQCQPNELK
jgi:hypothetical protein